MEGRRALHQGPALLVGAWVSVCCVGIGWWGLGSLCAVLVLGGIGWFWLLLLLVLAVTSVGGCGCRCGCGWCSWCSWCSCLLSSLFSSARLVCSCQRHSGMGCCRREQRGRKPGWAPNSKEAGRWQLHGTQLQVIWLMWSTEKLDQQPNGEREDPQTQHVASFRDPSRRTPRGGVESAGCRGGQAPASARRLGSSSSSWTSE